MVILIFTGEWDREKAGVLGFSGGSCRISTAIPDYVDSRLSSSMNNIHIRLAQLLLNQFLGPLAIHGYCLSSEKFQGERS